MQEVKTHPNRINQLLNNQTNLSTPLANISILIVGVGGIGCQILKVLSKMPIGTTHIIDMDTIQLSNLNRQFLFKHQHKGMSKSLVARQTVMKLNPNFNVVAHHKNIKELPINFFKQFNYLIMALDNVEARNYVNKVGIRLNIPIIDAGTLAYKGNVTTIIPRQTRCYSCQPKSSQQKVFPVCTIRMRPQKPIHCIVWAKLLFEALFGLENQDNDLKDLSQLAKNENIVEIMVKLFEKDILDIKNAKSESDNKLSQIFAKSIKVIQKQSIESNIGSTIIDSFLDHQVKQSLEKNISLFAQSFHRLTKQKVKDGMITFEKDDDNIIHFIASGANLRMHCFNIQEQTFNEVKNMAGNIVPAIASTNSIVSGIQITQMIKHIKNQNKKMKSFFIQNQNNKIIPLTLQKSFSTCQVCHQSAIPVIIQVDLTHFTLQNLVTLINSKLTNLQEFSINQASKQFYNSDDPKQKLLEKPLFQLCSSLEVDLILTDQNQSKKVCIIWLIHNQQINAQEPIIKNQEQFFRKQEPKPTEEQKQNGVQNKDDDDVVMFDDQSPQCEIIQVKKKEQTEEIVQVIQPIQQELKQIPEQQVTQNDHYKENGSNSFQNGQISKAELVEVEQQQKINGKCQNSKDVQAQSKPIDEIEQNYERIGDGVQAVENGEADVVKKKVKTTE